MSTDDRLAEIALGLEKPGATGALYRLLQRADVAVAVTEWMVAEKERGTPFSYRMIAIAEFIGMACYGVAIEAGSKMKPCAQDIMGEASARLGANIKIAQQVLKTQTSVTRMPPRFRVIEGGEPEDAKGHGNDTTESKEGTEPSPQADDGAGGEDTR